MQIVHAGCFLFLLLIARVAMASDSRAALLKASTPPSDTFFSTLITANHILHNQGVLDAYGHISARNPQDPATFFLSRNLAPALVASRDDIEEYRVEDAAPVNKNGTKGYVERLIHSEIYKRYKDVNSVVHSHSEAVVPFSVSSVPVSNMNFTPDGLAFELTAHLSFDRSTIWAAS